MALCYFGNLLTYYYMNSILNTHSEGRALLTGVGYFAVVQIGPQSERSEGLR